MWNGNIAPRTSLLKMFSITQSLFFSEYSDYILEKHPQKNDVFMVLNTVYQNHHFSMQRIVWTYNCRIRNQIDQCLILVLMFLIFSNFSYLFEPQYELQRLLMDTHYNYTDTSEQELLLITELQNTYYQYQIYLDIVIGLNFTFKPLFILYYDWTQQLQTKFSVQDLMCFILGLFSIFQWVFIPNCELVEEPYRFDILVTFRWMYISICIIQCILSLRNFKLFGPMIKALWLVVLECSKFTFIFIVVNLLFGFMAYFSFYENINNRFKSLVQSLLYLTEALFGQFSFSEFSQTSPIYAPIFLNVFLFFSPIIFMQLLVAVLTFTFETASRSGRVHYFLGTIENLRNLEYDAVCGCLVALPIIGNIFNVVFILAHMLSDPDPTQKEHNIDVLKKINRVLVRLGYFPIYFMLTIFCVLMNLFFSPFFYFVKFFRILGESSKDENYSKRKRLLKWAVLGYYYMFVQTYRDFQTNYKYLMHGKFLNDSQQINISNNTYSILASVAKDFYLKTRERQNKVVLTDYLNSVLKKMKTIEQKAQEKQKKLESKGNTQKEFQDNLLNHPQDQDEKSSYKVTHSFIGDNKNGDSPVSRSIQENDQGGQIRERIGQSIPKVQNTIDLYEKQKNILNQIQGQQPASDKKDIHTLNMIKEISSESISNITEIRNSHRNNYFTNKIRSLIYEDVEEKNEETQQNNQDNQQKKVQITHLHINPSHQQNSSRSFRAITQNYIQEEPELPKVTQDDLPQRKSRLYENEAQFRIQLELIKTENSSKLDKNKVDEDQFQFKKDEIADNDGTEENSGRKNNGQEKASSLGSAETKGFTRDLKLNVMTHQSSYSQPNDNSTHNKKRRKTTFQMWKKLKKENNNNQTFIKDTENLYQFLDAFVVDEEELANNNDASDYSRTDKDETEGNEIIYIENLLKLMYHYSKNDVKLARFNILFQAVKKLFKGE